MFIQRYYLDCLSHASYMVADEETHEAAIIDPQRDIDIYVKDAEEQGYKIRYAILTHFHADFVAGHIELRDRVGAEIVLGEVAEAEFPHISLKDGESLALGKIRLQGLSTPGHTPEGLTILAFDPKRGTDPVAAFTGDTLFVGDVGRPDLLASIGFTAEQLGAMLYDSLHEKLLALPDETLVYPAHGAGSMCGKSLGSEAFSTIGEQKKYNYALQPMSRDDFIALVTADQPEAPGYFVHDAILNRKERDSLDDRLQEVRKPLPLDDVLTLQKTGAQIVDTRDQVSFAGAHLKGAINIPVNGKYATWAGTLLNREAPIVVIADDEHLEESLMRLGRIGFDHVAGYLAEGLDSLQDHPELLQSVPRITAPAVPELAGSPWILDVRTEKEWNTSHLEGSHNIPLNQLTARLGEVPGDQKVVVHCQSGYRSSIAASILQKAGFDQLLDLVGGFKAWQQSKLPVVEDSPVG